MTFSPGGIFRILRLSSIVSQNLVARTSIRIQAEDYVDAYDTTPENLGGAYREGSVDIEAATEEGYCVSYLIAGEWLTYSFLSQGGNYEVRARIASVYNDTFTIKVSCGSESTTFSFGGTGWWQTWETAIGGVLNIPSGTQTLRVDFLSSAFNFNYIDLIPVN